MPYGQGSGPYGQPLARGGKAEQNYGSHKGRRFWSGVYDAHDGYIRETHPYETAQANDFHHSMYVSPSSQDAMRQGDAGFFWMEPEGKVQTSWRNGSAPPHIVRAIKDQLDPLSRGGRAAATEPDDAGVPIVAAGGEYVLSPDQVRAAGRGDAEVGCKVLDEFVKRSRTQNIKTLKGLPGPAKD
jgi:hypothetical protein